MGCAHHGRVARRARDLFGVYVLLATFAIAMLEGAAETAAASTAISRSRIGALLALPVVAYVVFGLAVSGRTRAMAALVPAELTALGMLGALLAFPSCATCC